VIINELSIPGTFEVLPQRHEDHRGHFARTFCEREFAEAGLPTRFVQCNVSFNTAKGTLRGMHYQADPSPEGKLVRCTSGAIRDVLVDLRPGSPTHLQWVSRDLSTDNGAALYVPPGLAHGFVTLTDRAEVFYMMTEYFEPTLARGVRWNDPAFAIDWKLADLGLDAPSVISERDADYPDYGPGETGTAS
jgi:dTDP-4-dehydrorhamnose 3,5-epimerase